MPFRGYVDICQQSHVAGWAADESGRRAPVTIRVNGQPVTAAPSILLRPDLPAHGVSQEAGFTFFFAEPLGKSDVVEVLFPDESHLAESPCTSHQQRLRELLDGIDPQMHGIELGPLDRPILGKREYNILYVDHATREDLLEKYKISGSPETLMPERIVPVDIVWPGGPIAPLLNGRPKPDYCIASHVIEHVPNVIGWLQHLAGALKEGGILSLAIPDKTRTFDHNRATSRPADLIDAYVRRLQAPSARHIFDHVTSVSPVGTTPQRPSPELIRQALEDAVAAEQKGVYMDVHCHVFTQQSFLEVFGVLAHTGLLPVKLRRFFPTRENANEFIVSLETSDESPDQKAGSYYRAAAELSPQPVAPPPRSSWKTLWR
jgi:hypothetical protein